jgi:hypothetical protein
MRVPTQRGMRPEIGPRGLRIKDIDQGSYAYVPDHWPYKNDLPRGAFPGSQPGLEDEQLPIRHDQAAQRTVKASEQQQEHDYTDPGYQLNTCQQAPLSQR